MLQNKDIKKISELKNDFTPRWFEVDYILGSLNCFSFSKLCKNLNPLKLRGYSFEMIFSSLICLPFLGMKSINTMSNSALSNHVQARKDVFYRLKNNTSICWRMILWMFAVKFIKLVKENGEEPSGSVKCLIIDDSDIVKTGAKIEKVSKIWNHVINRSILGYKLLVMGYWDGTSFIPLDFSLHREKGNNRQKPFGLSKRDFKMQYKKKRTKGTHSRERAWEADTSKIENAQKMFWRAVSQGIKADYLLVDSWFTCKSFLKEVSKVHNQVVHMIGMYRTPKTNFEYQGKKMTYKQIHNVLGKHKRCRKLGLHYKEAIVTLDGQPLKMFFSRQGTKGKWKVFLTTNTGLTFIKMLEIYQIRWTIEVFFKEAKQLLGLGKCQSKDFDAQIADATITMIQYILLTLKYRFENYESKGALFQQMSEMMIQARLNERLWGLFIELLSLIETLFEGVDEMELIKKIMNDDKAYQILNRLLSDHNLPVEEAA